MKQPANEEGYPEEDYVVKRLQAVVHEHCQSTRLHKPHESSWNQTDPTGVQESFIRLTFCPGTGRVVDR